MKKQDFILIGIILIIAVSIFAVLRFGAEDGSYVNVEINGKVAQSYPLKEDRELVIETAENGKNTLVIKDGFASVTEANCPDKTCVHHKEISENGESIICLPHKLVITVSDKNEAEQIDAVS